MPGHGGIWVPVDMGEVVEGQLGKVLPEGRLHPPLKLPRLRLVFAGNRIIGEVAHDVVNLSLDGRSGSSLHRCPDFNDEAQRALPRSVCIYVARGSYRVRE